MAAAVVIGLRGLSRFIVPIAVRGDFDPNQRAERHLDLWCAAHWIGRLESSCVNTIHRVEIRNVREKDCCAYHVSQREPQSFQNIGNNFQATSGLGGYITVDEAARYCVARDLTSEENEIPSHNCVRVRSVCRRDVCVREEIVFHIICNLYLQTSPLNNRH